MRREYADFRVSSDGEVQGVGLLIAQEPASGRLMVLAPIRGGPADKAGVLPGDEVSSMLMSSNFFPQQDICSRLDFCIELTSKSCLLVDHRRASARCPLACVCHLMYSWQSSTAHAGCEH